MEAFVMLGIGIALATGMGVALGLLGGGGSILTVPLLVYVLGQGTREAITTSLLVVAVTSVAALVPHARGGRVRWRTGLTFGATSMLSAFGAGRLAHFVPTTVLLIAFGVVMLVAAVAMMRRPSRSAEAVGAVVSTGEEPKLATAKILLTGLAVGAVTGLVGAGGGFVVVPALVLLGGLPMRHAVGTSLLVIAMQSTAALAGHLGSTHIDLPLAAILSLAAVVGSIAGSTLAGRVPEDRLRKGFAWFVVALATLMLAQQVPLAFASNPITSVPNPVTQ